jgi:uncharacterized protein YjeT (DUF2065 family)
LALVVAKRPAVLNVIGVVTMLLGALVLWWITPIYSGGAAPYWDKELQAEINKAVEARKRAARFGILLVIIGAIFQILALRL